jgi:CBS domain-containing protein
MLQADVSGCPVINEQGQLVGVLSESDLIWKVRSTQQQ